MNREAFGAETDVPWRMGLTTANGTFYVHPTFLYESLWNVAGFILIHIFSKKYRKYDGQVFLLYLAWYGFGRFLIEGLRTDSLYLGNTDIRVSQLVAALTFSVAVFLLLRNKMRRKCTPDDLFVNRAGGDQAAVAQAGTDERAASQNDDGDHHESDTSDAAMKAADE
jgi:phosphatidylglycerol:prolipoprotein diacylglycerol transferase